MILQISEWTVQWKMNFNPDPNKQASELLFSWKTSSKPYPSLDFNDNPIHQVQLEKHLGLVLDPKLSGKHIPCVLIKTCKIIGLIRKLQPIIPRVALLTTIYKSFLRSHLDYGDVICDHTFKESFQNKLEPVQHNAALAVRGAIRGSLREKLYQELGLDSLKPWWWYWKLCLFFKLKKINVPLTSLIWFWKSYQREPLETITTSPYLMLSMNTSKTLFSHPLLLSGISLIIIFKFWNWLVLLKTKS